jgi:hypothetical protein
VNNYKNSEKTIELCLCFANLNIHFIQIYCEVLINWLARYARVVDHLAVRPLPREHHLEVDLLCFFFITILVAYLHTYSVEQSPA